MKKHHPWTATLTRAIAIRVHFESVDMQTGNTFAGYAVEDTLDPGPRRFRTKGNRDRWVALMNKEYGDGTAHLD